MALKTADENDSDVVVANDPDADRMGLAEKRSDGSWRIFTGVFGGVGIDDRGLVEDCTCFFRQLSRLFCPVQWTDDEQDSRSHLTRPYKRQPKMHVVGKAR